MAPGRDCVMAACALFQVGEASGLKAGLKGQQREHLHCRQRKRPLRVPEPHLPCVMVLHVPSSQEHQRHLHANRTMVSSLCWACLTVMAQVGEV